MPQASMGVRGVSARKHSTIGLIFMNSGFEDKVKGKRKMRMRRLFIGVIIPIAIVAAGQFCYSQDAIRVTQKKFENGRDKEVWIYKINSLGKKEKIKEIAYYKNGNVEAEIDYKDGAVNGWARLYYESGKLHVEATYKNNKTHGVRNAYHENGQRFCRAEYDNGKLLSRKNWDEQGKEIYIDMERP